MAINIYKMNLEEEKEEKQKELVSVGGGNWTSHIWFDGKVLWKVSDSIEEWNYENCKLLPSDTQHREDKMLLIMKDVDNADKY